jgi:hypothetical protein
MKPPSPVDAISPAFSRTRSVLYPPGPAPDLPAPFRFWFFLKIAIVAALTQANIYGAVFGIAFELSFFALAFASSGGVWIGVKHSHLILGHAGAGLLIAMLISGFFIIAIGILFAWIWCRLRFTLFDLVVYRHGSVARAWSPYASQAWRFLGLTLLIALALLVLFALSGGSLILHLVAVTRHLSQQQISHDPSLFLAHILPLYGLVLLFAIVAGIVNALGQDFILPPMALEDASLETAFSRFMQLLRTQAGHIALYLLLRYALEIGIALVGGMVLFLVLAILGIGGGGIGFLLYRACWHTGTAGDAVFILYCVVAGLVLVAAYLLILLALYGFTAVVKQSYAVCFYGSIYPQLGDRLEPTPLDPPTTVIPVPPPDPFPPPEPAT